MFRRLFLLTFVLASVLINASVSLYLVDESISYGHIHYGVSIYDQSVSFVTKEKATDDIDGKIKASLKDPLTIKYKNKQWQISPADLRARPDAKTAVEDAFKVGRTGSFLTQIKTRANLWLGGHTEYVVSNLKNIVLIDLENRISSAIDIPAQNAGLRIEGVDVIPIKAKNGFGLDRESFDIAMHRRIADFSSRTLILPVKVFKVEVRDKDTSKARKTAFLMMKAPIILKMNDKRHDVTREEIGGIIDFASSKSKPGKKILIASISKDRLNKTLEPFSEEVGTKPQDARFEAGAGVVTIVPSVNGTVIDIDDAFKKVSKLVMKEAPRNAGLKLKYVEASLTTKKAEQMGIKERVSVHTEYFDFTANRSKNIGTLADEINGKLVAPEEVFSLNNATGPRTTAKGYTEAPVIVDGQLSPDVGGGICNVSTTLFNVVFFGGYEVVERYPHDFYISHYPSGRDASVYYDGGMDFRFRNDSPYYILIKTDHSDSSVTIAFYSTKMSQDVIYDDTGFTGIVPFGISYKDDPTLPAGWEKEGEFGYGVEGRDITVHRTVTRDGKMIHDDRFSSHYEPKHRIIMKGTGAPLPPGTPPPPGAQPAGTAQAQLGAPPP